MFMESDLALEKTLMVFSIHLHNPLHWKSPQITFRNGRASHVRYSVYVSWIISPLQVTETLNQTGLNNEETDGLVK